MLTLLSLVPETTEADERCVYHILRYSSCCGNIRYVVVYLAQVKNCNALCSSYQYGCLVLIPSDMVVVIKAVIQAM